MTVSFIFLWGLSIIQIQTLEHRLLNMADRVVDHEGKIKVIYNKYLRLKRRKDEREFALKKSIESLQVRKNKKHRVLCKNLK